MNIYLMQSSNQNVPLSKEEGIKRRGHFEKENRSIIVYYAPEVQFIARGFYKTLRVKVIHSRGPYTMAAKKFWPSLS
jgi:hypothetical protein